MSKKLIITITVDGTLDMPQLIDLIYDDPPLMLDGAEFEIVDIVDNDDAIVTSGLTSDVMEKV